MTLKDFIKQAKDNGALYCVRAQDNFFSGWGLSTNKKNILYILCNDASQRANALYYLNKENNYKYVYECDIDNIKIGRNTICVLNNFPVANVRNNNIMRYSYNDNGTTIEINGVEY